jgi:tetratricopeptide (TPR) repeat protein
MASATLRQALALHRAGRLKEAEAGYRQALAEQPGNVDALHFLGVAAHQSGRHTEAIDLIRQAIVARPCATFWYNLAQVHLARTDEPAAEEAFRETIAIAPDHAEALFHLGNMHRARCDIAGAIDCYRRALAAKSGFVDAHVNLGLLLKETGEAAEAVGHLETADRLRPNDPGILNNLGIVRKSVAPLDAVEDFRRALALDPRFAEAAANLATLLISLARHGDAISALETTLNAVGDDVGLRMLLAATCAEADRPADAIAHYEKAAAAEPHSAHPLVALGRMHRRIGQFENAYGYYRTARQLDPNNFEALLGTLNHLKALVPEQEMARISELADDPTLSLERRRQLHFAISQCREAAGDYDAAFHHMHKGNALRRLELEPQSGAYDPAGETARVDRTIEVFDADYFRRVSTFGVASELPVFIVGMPRSGTTLCEQILASHSQVFGADELPDIGRIARELRRRFGDRNGGSTDASYAQHLTGEIVRSIAERHLERLRSLSSAALRITDKLPMNYYRLGLIATLFPRARIIHCRRDPLDTSLSCYSRNLAFMPIWCSDLGAIGHVYREYERLMAHWRRVLPISILDFRYEDVVGDLERSARQLIEYCGLPWETTCLEFYRTDRQLKTASIEQARRPIYASSIGRWKKFKRHLAPLREALSGEPA